MGRCAGKSIEYEQSTEVLKILSLTSVWNGENEDPINCEVIHQN